MVSSSNFSLHASSAEVMASTFASLNFPTSIAEKLDNTNYLHWRPYVEPMINSHKLHHFIVNPVIPSRFLTEYDTTLDIANLEYEGWEVQDQTLLVWLQSTLSKSILLRVLGANHYHEVRDRIHEYFGLQTKSCARQLCTAMCATKLESKSTEVYLLIIKGYVYEIAGLGMPMIGEQMF
ncbi:hypothetical protein V8G54_027595 [Vigna mungo]|uniref:Retrotransposon Copia-like N-terminal domain-containing protein n=1 Tax=Vigna mungo TaxID=3915 RepID=A0AAQ3N2K6_VIGMU